MIYKKITSALICLSTLSFATVYSDGEEGTTTGWRVYDNSPTGATIENIVDTDKNSKVIEFKGDGRKNAYMIGNKKNTKGWKNSTELTMKWSMNFSEKFKISVYLETKNGSRVLYYDGKDQDRGIYKNKYIRLGLGSSSKSGQWIDISRNLEADLQKYEPSNYIKMVSGFKIQGSGKIDNLELINDNAQPIEALQVSDIEIITLNDNYAKVAWKLNHKATGQVEYGTTTDYGNFSNKEDSFKFNQHRQSLRGLEAGTTYHYRIISEDEVGSRVVSEDKTFTTTGEDISEFKKWNDKQILADGKKIQVIIKKEDNYIYGKEEYKFQVIIKDITNADAPSVLSTYEDSLTTYGNFMTSVTPILSEDGTKVYLFTKFDNRDYNTYESQLTIYDISNLKVTTRMSRVDLKMNYYAIDFLNNHQISIKGDNGDWDANEWDKGGIYRRIIDISDPNAPIVGEKLI